MNTDTELPNIPEVTDVDIAFPCRYKELLPKWGDLTEEERRGKTLYCEAGQSLFFRGGKLEDYGIKLKEGIDEMKVYQYLRATLGDWGPKHEHKVGGIGHMLAKWCEPIEKGAQQ